MAGLAIIGSHSEDRQLHPFPPIIILSAEHISGQVIACCKPTHPNISVTLYPSSFNFAGNMHDSRGIVRWRSST